MHKPIISMLLSFCFCLMLTNVSNAAVVFETNFDNLTTWNPSGTDACWENTQVEGGSNSCTQEPWGSTWVSAESSTFNDYRLVTPQCSSIAPMHIGNAEDIRSATGHSDFSAYGGTGKAYVHIYEPCLSGSGGWGSDGLLGVYFGKNTGYDELYVQFKVKFDPNWVWQNGAQMKLAHIMHFGEESNQGVLQAYNMFDPYNVPDMVPGLYFNSTYYPYPQPYTQGYYLGGAQGAATPHEGPVNLSDGNWHIVQYRVKLNTGTSANGISQMWIDAETSTNPLINYSNIPYTGGTTKSLVAHGFNRVIIGGNSNNLFGPADGRTQWYTVDDLVVSTTAIPLDYAPGGAVNGDEGDNLPSIPQNLEVR